MYQKLVVSWGRHSIEASALEDGILRVTSEGSHQLLLLFSQGRGSALESSQHFLLKASLLAKPSLDLKPPPLSLRAFACGTRSSPPAGQLRVEAGQTGASHGWTAQAKGLPGYQLIPTRGR